MYKLENLDHKLTDTELAVILSQDKGFTRTLADYEDL